jgi:chromosome segregation ATPase
VRHSTREALAYLLSQMVERMQKARVKRAKAAAELTEAEAELAELEQRIRDVEDDLAEAAG